MARGTPAPEGTLIQLPNGYFNMKTADGWKLTQRVVMEEHLGRPLEANERVYFTNKNADKAAPKIEDLEVRIVQPKQKPLTEDEEDQIKELVREEFDRLMQERSA